MQCQPGILFLYLTRNMSKVITPREQDYSKWYNDIVVEAGLADHSAVRGCIVIKPHGFAIWENMQQALDKMFKDTGHQNAYFPLFIPKSLFEAEEKNAEGCGGLHGGNGGAADICAARNIRQCAYSYNGVTAGLAARPGFALSRRGNRTVLRKGRYRRLSFARSRRKT